MINLFISSFDKYVLGPCACCDGGDRDGASICCYCFITKLYLILLGFAGTVAHQAPLSMGFSRQEYYGGLPFPSPGDLPSCKSPPLARGFLTTEAPGMPEASLIIVLFLVRLPSPRTEDDPTPRQLPIRQDPFNSLWPLKMTVPCRSYPNRWDDFPWHGPATPFPLQTLHGHRKPPSMPRALVTLAQDTSQGQKDIFDMEGGGTQSFACMPEPFVLNTQKRTCR